MKTKPSNRQLLYRRRFLVQSAAVAGLGLVGVPWSRAASSPPVASSPAEMPTPSRFGTHGMVLFGGFEGLYTSHMPMFHGPHDVQAVFRVRIAAPSLDARLRRTLARAHVHWSIEPEPFDLDRAAPDAADRLPGWRANVFEGHFERGGLRRYENVSFVVEQTPIFSILDPHPRVADHQEFVCLGQGREHFLVKCLDQRPDVDLIGRFRTAEPASARGIIKTVGSSRNAAADPDLQPAFAQAGIKSVGGVTWVYTETSDLQ
ncbi:MAG: hypothetical protein JOY60_14455 [Burkholderiaceae bacterium]|nr:hypothetical protein [Roseateles sp.]MBV8471049.1 hypothetical protein [Burkholderiaceae bacterium]